MLKLKHNSDQVFDRLRRFLTRQMRDSILVTLWGVNVWDDDHNKKARADFEKKWGTHNSGQARPFPSNEEIFQRNLITLEARSRLEDDELPVVYSILDVGEGMVGAMFGQKLRYFARGGIEPGYGYSEPFLPDYSRLPDVSFSTANEWARRLLSIQEYFQAHMDGRLAQHPCLTLDALNFAVEARGATVAYEDLFEYPQELRALMELGLDFNIRFQEAQMARMPNQAGGCFVWLPGWAPFPRAVSLSVDAYTLCAPAHYQQFGFEYQSRLIKHFGHGMMHFHCNRADLAAEVAKLPNLELFQFGGDPKDPVPEIERLPAIRQVVGDIPLMLACDGEVFQSRLAARQLPGNAWYQVFAGKQNLNIDAANRLMDTVRAYRA